MGGGIDAHHDYTPPPDSGYTDSEYGSADPYSHLSEDNP